MAHSSEHYAKNVLFACIDDRLVESHLKFIIKIGGAFYPAVAGGGLAFVDESERAIALKQVVASYQINQVNQIYIESHTGCGAYKLAGITFASREDEIARLYADLDTAKQLVETALKNAGADMGQTTVHTSVVDPPGELVPRPDQN